MHAAQVRDSLHEVDSSLGGGGGRGSPAAGDGEAVADLAGRAELASETAGALLAGRRGRARAWAPWAWAWGFGGNVSGAPPEARTQAQRLADFLDPFRALLSLRAPTLRSK